jgi:Mg-chelatase subunit ChlD
MIARGHADRRGQAVDPAQGLLLLSQRYCIDPDDLDGWKIAESYSASSCAIHDPALRAFARRLATRAVLRKAWEVVGPVRSATRPIREVLSEPFRGELDEELTLENIMGKEFPDPEDWISVRREAPRRQVVLMMDTSLSMSGRNLALAAVAAAVLAFKVKSEDLAVVAFENQARTLTRLYDSVSADVIVEAILSQPAQGFTNIEDALGVGRAELARGDNPQKVGLLITDGVFTAGNDPIAQAALFPKLFVLLTEDYVMDAELCRKMARAGKGEIFRVCGYQDLPRRMLEVANRILR